MTETVEGERGAVNGPFHSGTAQDTRVILLDPTVASGAAAVMAIRVLLDHDVAEENIMIMSLLVAEQGVKTVAYNYPRVSHGLCDTASVTVSVCSR